MLLSLNWIKKFVNIPESLSAQEIADLLTLHTAEIEGFEDQSISFENMVVGKILEVKPHPDADKLRITTVDIGTSTPVQIVCGGSNLFQNQLVAVALPKSKVRWHGEGDLITLKETKIRGEESFGMICAAEEINLGKSQGSEIVDLSHLSIPAGTPLAEALHKNDIIFEVDNKAITNRPDLWGHYGFARELAVLTNSELISPEEAFYKYSTNKEAEVLEIPKSGKEINLTIENPEIVHQWNSILVSNITVEPSPEWLQNRLEAIGVKPINNIVDVTNFVMYELGQPMHAYDTDSLSDLNLNIRFATEKDSLETIDHKTRKLTSQDPILTTSNNNPLIILGVMGGVNSEITENTTSIMLESACFDPVVIRKSSTHHTLRSDSSQRFEKTLDPNQALPALEHALRLLLRICPQAKIEGPITSISNKEVTPLTVELHSDKINNYLGINLPQEEINRILTSLEFKIISENSLKVEIPTFRSTKDVQTEVDIIEEIARIYGYENIPESIPTLPLTPPIENLERSKEHKIKSHLQATGLDEIINYSFYSENDLKNTLLNTKEHLKLQNYLSNEQTHLRTTLLTNLLKTTFENLKNFSEIKVFEIGRTYKENLQEAQFYPIEEDKLAILVTDTTGTGNPFLKLKGILETLLQTLLQSNFQLNVSTDNSSAPYFHPKKLLEITHSRKVNIGFAGIIHPLVQENFNLKQEVAYAEINLNTLKDFPIPTVKFKEFNNFPTTEFDMSIIVPTKTYAKTVQKALKSASPLITSVSLFDIYQGENLPTDTKALAFKIILQAPDRTLTEEETKAVEQKCLDNLAKIGAKLRD